MSLRFIVWGLVSVVVFTLGLVSLAFCVGDLVASLQAALHPKMSIVLAFFVSGAVFLAGGIAVLTLVISLMVRVLQLQREQYLGN